MVHSQEWRQAVTRLVSIGTVLGYLWITRILLGGHVADALLVVLQIWLVFAVANVLSFYWVPGACAPRRVATLVGDLAVAAVVADMGGEMLAPFFAVYLGVILGHGIRYGEGYLVAGTVLGALGFLGVLAHNEYWRAHTLPGLGFLFTLVLIPLLAYALLRDARVAKEQALAASREKGKFAATLSHEIRTPLASITALADRIARQSERAGSRQAETARLIHAACRMLLSLTEDILDISRIEAGEFSLSLGRVHPYRFLRATLDAARPVAEMKGLELVGAVELSVPPVVRGDERRLAQVLLNLVSNAIKFTSEGWVKVHLSAREAGAGRPGVVGLRFEVADSGVGIPEGLDRERLFQRFARGRDGPEGAGLGMAIAAEIVERIGGEIGIAEGGPGAVFWFEVPVEVPGHRREQRHPLAPPPGTAAVVVEREPAGASPGVAAEVPVRRVGLAAALEPCGAAVRKGDVVFADAALDGPRLRPLARACWAREVPVIVHRREGEAPATPPFGRIWGLHTGPITAGALARGARLRGELGPGDGPRDASGSRALQVLVAEDDPLNEMALTLSLDALGCEYEVVKDGASAYRRLSEGDFDLAFLDRWMPGMGGLEVIRRLGADGVGTPLVVLSADATREAIAAAFEAGAVDYLLKPVTAEQLDQALRTWGPGRRTHRLALGE